GVAERGLHTLGSSDLQLRYGERAHIIDQEDGQPKRFGHAWPNRDVGPITRKIGEEERVAALHIEHTWRSDADGADDLSGFGQRGDIARASDHALQHRIMSLVSFGETPAALKHIAIVVDERKLDGGPAEIDPDVARVRTRHQIALAPIQRS